MRALVSEPGFSQIPFRWLEMCTPSVLYNGTCFPWLHQIICRFHKIICRFCTTYASMFDQIVCRYLLRFFVLSKRRFALRCFWVTRELGVCFCSGNWLAISGYSLVCVPEHVDREFGKSRPSKNKSENMNVRNRRVIIKGLLRYCPAIRWSVEVKIGAMRVTSLENHRT